jgi:hypothetical protein
MSAMKSVASSSDSLLLVSRVLVGLFDKHLSTFLLRQPMSLQCQHTFRQIMCPSVAGDAVPMRDLNFTFLSLAAGCRLSTLYLHVLVDICVAIPLDA